MNRDLDTARDWQRRSVERSRERAREKYDHKYRRIGRNRQRSREARERDFGDKGVWIRTLPCVCCNRTPSEAAHAKSRGAGGTSRHLVPLHSDCHRRQHSVGIGTFEAERGVDLMAEAEHYERAWRERQV